MFGKNIFESSKKWVTSIGTIMPVPKPCSPGYRFDSVMLTIGVDTNWDAVASHFDFLDRLE